MTTGPHLASGWLTGDQAAALAGITPASFRREVSRSPELQQARAYLGPLACYPERAVQAWLQSRPGQGRKPSTDPVAARHQAQNRNRA